MKKTTIFLTLFTLLFLAGCTTSQPNEKIISQPIQVIGETDFSDGTYTLDTELSTITYTGFGVGKSHIGTFSLTEGIIEKNEGKVSGDFTIDITSMTAESDRLLGHLKSADFFDVENNPTATLTITDIDDNYQVTGDLTMKGNTHEVSFPAKVSGEKVAANFKIDRTKWDIKYGSGSFFDDLGDKAIKDEVEIGLNLQFVKN